MAESKPAAKPVAEKKEAKGVKRPKAGTKGPVIGPGHTVVAN